MRHSLPKQSPLLLWTSLHSLISESIYHFPSLLSCWCKLPASLSWNSATGSYLVSQFSVHSSDSSQLWLFKNTSESSLLRFLKLLQKFPMALVVQSESSPRICQPCHHFIHSSHAYHFPDTFSLYGPILLLPQGLSICCYPYLGHFPPKYSHSSSPPTLQVFIIPSERDVWLYFLTCVALGKPFTFSKPQCPYQGKDSRVLIKKDGDFNKWFWEN